uniref:hypothetical protein n=1 Tax=Rhizorhabdus wittichii TaxID=160791 RepID=UPI00055DEB61|nr:hypothetical protein [Rhizorhabdus wittichii]
MTTDPTRAAEIVVEQAARLISPQSWEARALCLENAERWKDAVGPTQIQLRETYLADADRYVAASIATAKEVLALVQRPTDTARAEEDVPIDMVLHCPACGLQHIDTPDLAPVQHEDGSASLWDNPPHRSHLCHGCGHIWRPADVPTNGVEYVQTKGKADSPLVFRATPSPVTDEAALSGEARVRHVMDAFRRARLFGEDSILCDDRVFRLFAETAIAALASTPQPAAAETVEQIAKIIDPVAWRGWGHSHIAPARKKVAREKAELILAAIRQSAKGGE